MVHLPEKEPHHRITPVERPANPPEPTLQDIPTSWIEKRMENCRLLHGFVRRQTQNKVENTTDHRGRQLRKEYSGTDCPPFPLPHSLQPPELLCRNRFPVLKSPAKPEGREQFPSQHPKDAKNIQEKEPIRHADRPPRKPGNPAPRHAPPHKKQYRRGQPLLHRQFHRFHPEGERQKNILSIGRRRHHQSHRQHPPYSVLPARRQSVPQQQLHHQQ